MAEKTADARPASPIRLLCDDLRQGVELRWQLARLEVESDLRSAKQLIIGLSFAAVTGLAALPVLAVCLAQLLDGCLGLGDTAWLAILGFGLLLVGPAIGYAAYRRFRRRFVGLRQTLEELQEDLIWLREWTGKAEGGRRKAEGGRV